MLTVEAEHRILEAAPPYLRVAIVLLVQTGGRTYSEGLSLKWDQVDLVHGVLHLDGNVKTSDSAQPLPLSRLACDVLKEWKKEQGSESPFVFRARASRASQYGVSGEHGGQLWRKPVYRISRFTICVTYSARVSVGSLQMQWCSGRCGTAVRKRSATINWAWLTKFARASKKPTTKPIKTKNYYVFTTLGPKRRKRLFQKSVSS